MEKTYEDYLQLLDQCYIDLKANVSEENTKWSMKTKSKGVVVKETKKPGNQTPCFKAVGRVPYPARKIVEEILGNQDDIERRRIWNPGFNKCDVLDRCTENGRNYTMYNDSQKGVAGGIISARDFAEVQDWTEDPETGHMMFVFVSITDDRIPEYDGFVRGTIYSGSGYYLEPAEDNPEESIVHYVVHTDIGGSIPQWIINRAITPEMINFYTLIPRAVAEISAS